jgi:hypothetical protein
MNVRFTPERTSRRVLFETRALSVASYGARIARTTAEQREKWKEFVTDL